MVLEIFASILSLGAILALIINVVIITIVLVIVDKIIAHDVSPKRSLLMGFIAYFLVPIALGLAATAIALPGWAFLFLPLVAWAALGEILLKGSAKQKLIVAIVAWIVYLALTYAGVIGLIAGLIPF